MQVLNIHERAFAVPIDRVGALLDTLASGEDALWPWRAWPPMRFDGPLAVGAAGGHGPIGYVVEAYEPGRTITFRFTAPRGYDGVHRFEVVETADGVTTLRHTIDMTVRGMAVLSWCLAVRHLHDALLEDALATAEAGLGMTPCVTPWPLRVRVLRWLMSGGKTQPQVIPDPR